MPPSPPPGPSVELPLDKTQTGLFCRVWCGGVNRVGPTATQVRSVSGLRRAAQCDRRTHLFGGQFTPPHRTRQDRRACLSAAAAATQARQAATPSRPPDRPHAATFYAAQNKNTPWTAAYD